MARACVTVRVESESVLSNHSFLDRRGEPRAWLDIGTGELGLYGAPAALRRLSTALLAAADRAEQLAREPRDAAASEAPANDSGGAGAREVARS